MSGRPSTGRQQRNLTPPRGLESSDEAMEVYVQPTGSNMRQPQANDKKRKANGEEDTNSGELASEALEQQKTEPEAKRRKTRAVGSCQPKRKKSERPHKDHLSPFEELPYDILLEILGQCDAESLFSLSSTNRELHDILFSKADSRSLWKTAMARSDIPPCPDDLSEIKYAELLYGRHCHTCYQSDSTKVSLWCFVRARTCEKCIEKNWILEKVASRKRDWSEDHLTRLNRQLRKYLVFSESLSPKGRITSVRYHPEILLLRKQYSDHKSTYGHGESASQRIIELMETQNNLPQRLEHAEQCNKWLETQKILTIKARQEKIIERLKKNGWAEELATLPQDCKPLNLPDVERAVKSTLTEEVMQSLDRTLGNFMQRVKKARLEREHFEFLKSRMSVLKETYDDLLLDVPASVFSPNVPDAFMDPIVKEVVLRPEPLPEDWKGLLVATLKDYMGRWEEPIKLQLIEMIKKSYTVGPWATKNTNPQFDFNRIFDLAAVSFSVDHVRTVDETLRYRSHRNSRYGGTQEIRALESIFSGNDLFWNIKEIVRFDPSVYEKVAECLSSCGFDPTTTTCAQLDEEDPIFECLLCHSHASGRCTFRWFHLAKHLSEHGNDWKSNVCLLLDNDAKRARIGIQVDYEKAHNAVFSTSDLCAHCRKKGRIAELLEHVHELHGVEEPVYGTDVVDNPAEPRFNQIHRLWPARKWNDPLLRK